MSAVPKLKPDCDMSERFQRWIAKWFVGHRWMNQYGSHLSVCVANESACRNEKTEGTRMKFLLFSSLPAPWPWNVCRVTASINDREDEYVLLYMMKFLQSFDWEAFFRKFWEVIQRIRLRISFKRSEISQRTLRCPWLETGTRTVSRLSTITRLGNSIVDAST
jgi:hypothetical protein